ncbi:MAG: hypothetical protein OEV33_01180 [Armatimonadota bacterium]|nr:hypothetical protein [Armatimonadota bacterium]
MNHDERLMDVGTQAVYGSLNHRRVETQLCHEHDGCLVTYEREDCPICTLIAEHQGQVGALRNQIEDLTIERDDARGC